MKLKKSTSKLTLEKRMIPCILIQWNLSVTVALLLLVKVIIHLQPNVVY